MQTSFTYLVFQPATDPNATVGLINIGKIVFTKQVNAPFPADASDRNGGFTITYQPVQGSHRSLSLVNGRLVSTDSTSTPAIGFILTYGLKSIFSQVETDTTAWPVLIGKIDGVQVIAVGDIPASPLPNLTSTSGSSKWQDDWVKLFSPKTTIDWVEVVGIVAGLAISLGIIAYMTYKTVQWIRVARALGRGELPTPTEIQAQLDRIERSLKETYLPEEEASDAMYLPQDLVEGSPEYLKQCETTKLARVNYVFRIQKDRFIRINEEYNSSIRILANYGVNELLQAATTKLGEATRLLNQATTPEKFVALRPDIATALDNVGGLVRAVTFSSSKLTAAERTKLEEQSKRIEFEEEWADKNYQDLGDLVEEGKSPLEPTEI